MDSKTKTQSSRKGKKAWRKNILVDDINQALEAKRERQVLHGDEAADDGGFVIDTMGFTHVKKPAAVLKTTEILTNKSKVPALAPRRTKQKISKARVRKLMVLAGRLITDSQEKARIDTDGLVKGRNVDLWGENEDKSGNTPVGPTTVSYTKPTRVPSTLKHEPLHLRRDTPGHDFVHAGKSYNPSLESWKNLIDREFGTEYEKQMKIQAMQQEQESIQYLMETLRDDELENSDDIEDDEEEKEKENEENHGNDQNKYKLSVNESVRVKRKTRTQRNKQARHKKMLELHRKLKELKIQLRDIGNLRVIEKQVQAKASVVKVRKPRVYKKHSEHDPVFTPIELKLSDELTNNLRAVRPEGNIFYEQMNKLQMSGKVEARVPVSDEKRRKQKFAGKHSYRHFK